jgi:Fe2+ transport system protein FeoA
MKTLLDVHPRTKVMIRNVSGGKGVRRNLAQLGIGIGSVVVVERDAPLQGPLLIKHDGTRIVVGRGIAAKVRVEEIAQCG